MEHPAKHLSEPVGPPDHITVMRDYRCNEYWFKDSLMTQRIGYGDRAKCLLNVCPVTGRLMYMTSFFPIIWEVLNDDGAQEAYLRFLVEKDLLDGKR